MLTEAAEKQRTTLFDASFLIAAVRRASARVVPLQRITPASPPQRFDRSTSPDEVEPNRNPRRPNRNRRNRRNGPRRIERITAISKPHLRNVALIAPLVVCDLLALIAATLVAFAVLRAIGPLPVRGIHRIMPPLATALLLGYAASGLYAVVGINPVVELRQLTRTNTLILLAILMATYVADAQPFWRVFFGALYLATIVLQPLLRAQARSWCARQSWWAQPALVFGSPAAADAVASRLLKHPGSAVRPVALVIIACDTLNSPRIDESSTVLPTIDIRRAARLARRTGISYGIVVTGEDPVARLAAVANTAALSLPHLLMMNADGDAATLWADARECGGMAAVQVRNRLLLPWPRFVKRSTDLALTLVGGLLILPLLICLAALVKLTSPGPIFYGQTRIGRNGKTFKAWKFRSMRKDADAALEKYLAAHPDLREEWEQDHKLKIDPRVTAVGRFLRKTSLDELPQIWNIICGTMSLVGPRPIVDAEIEKYGAIFMQYTRVRPGLTGMWQVSGRNNTTYAERVHFDDYYVRNWSPWFDLHILALTGKVLVTRQGAF